VTVAARRRCASPEEAERLAAAIVADDPGSFRLRTEGSDLLLEVTGRSAARVRATLDDLLACLAAAEGTARASRGRPPAP